MKTYLTLWFSSEGAEPTKVAERLQGMGFQPITGPYDHVYDWKNVVALDQILKICTSVHQTLKGMGVLYKIETV